MGENTEIWREIAELRGRLQAVAMPFCQSETEAEELVSRAIERAVGNAAKYDATKGNLFVWMRTILVNIALNDAKAREIRKTYSYDMDELANDEAMATSATDERILASSDEEALKAAINRLAPAYKKTVIMHYMMDMPLKEIAKVLHRPIGTVKWRLSVAKDVLAGMLKKTLGRPGTWALLLVGLITGCVATYMVMRLPPRKQSDPTGGIAYNTPKVHEITVHRAPKEVKIDGDLGEWTAPVFEASCNPPYDRDYRVSIRMMWDENRLYIGGDIRTPDPMRDRVMLKRIFTGGSVICRLAADPSLGCPLSDKTIYDSRNPPAGPLPDDGLVSIILFYDYAHKAAALRAHTRIRNACSFAIPDGAWRGVYREHNDGCGYSLEYAVDWHALGIAPPEEGEARANTWNIHYSDNAGTLAMGQIAENFAAEMPRRYAHVPPHYSFYYPTTWGKAVFE